MKLGALFLSWIVPLAFLVWAVRIAFLEGYVYVAGGDFLGDFTRTALLGAPTWWTGQGLFYGPIFVLEYRFLVVPQLMTPGDFARLDFVLFVMAFACVWLALFGVSRLRLAIFVLAAWFGHHLAVQAFSNTAHLEILELTFICVALLLAVRGHTFSAGGALGLAVATKTLPAVFFPYLVVSRQWRMLVGAVVFATVPFVIVCWLQGISLAEGLYSLVYQGGNLTKLEYSEYEYTLRAEIARMLAGDGGTVTSEQAQLAIGLHWAIAIVVMLAVGWVLLQVRIDARTYGLMFGLVAVVMLIAAPSAHPPYYIFLLPAWTAILANLLGRPFTAWTFGLWVALAASYTFTGFDQPFFLAQRLFGFGLVVPQNWLAWHLPTVGLFLTLLTLIVLVLNPQTNPAASPMRVSGLQGATAAR